LGIYPTEKSKQAYEIPVEFNPNNDEEMKYHINDMLEQYTEYIIKIKIESIEDIVSMPLTTPRGKVSEFVGN
jgi:23S rRNA maturation-related 3'-5' exoribonuclease YhaM